MLSQTPIPLESTLGRSLSQLSQKESEELARWMERLVDLMGSRGLVPGPTGTIQLAGMCRDSSTKRPPFGGQTGLRNSEPRKSRGNWQESLGTVFAH